VILDDMLRLFEPELRESIQNFAFEGDGSEHAIKGRQAIGGDQHQAISLAVGIPNFPLVLVPELGEVRALKTKGQLVKKDRAHANALSETFGSKLGSGGRSSSGQQHKAGVELQNTVQVRGCVRRSGDSQDLNGALRGNSPPNQKRPSDEAGHFVLVETAERFAPINSPTGWTGGAGQDQLH
jgi:hypothetical protein